MLVPFRVKQYTLALLLIVALARLRVSISFVYVLKCWMLEIFCCFTETTAFFEEFPSSKKKKKPDEFQKKPLVFVKTQSQSLQATASRFGESRHLYGSSRRPSWSSLDAWVSLFDFLPLRNLRSGPISGLRSALMEHKRQCLRAAGGCIIAFANANSRRVFRPIPRIHWKPVSRWFYNKTRILSVFRFSSSTIFIEICRRQAEGSVVIHEKVNRWHIYLTLVN